jgi:hypothetical protein
VDTLNCLASDVVILRALIHEAFFRQTAADDIMADACALVLQDRRDRIEALVRETQRGDAALGLAPTRRATHHPRPVERSPGKIAATNGEAKKISMLTILLATCKTTRDALRVADNPVDSQLLEDLELMIERTEGELVQIADFSEHS